MKAYLLAAMFASVANAQVPSDLALSTFGPATFSSPVAVRSPHDGTGRVFVVEQGGTIQVLDKNGASLGTFLDISTQVTAGGEQGLLGLAFDPNFGRDPNQVGYSDFYVAMTALNSFSSGASKDQLVRRFTVQNPQANVSSDVFGVDVIRLPDPYSNHNGGDIHFGPDGDLYYGMGDGGSGGDPNGFAQCLWKKTTDNTPANCGTVPSGQVAYYLLGKMMRIDVHHTTPAPVPGTLCGAAFANGAAAQYAIPNDNPYATLANHCGEIWLYGLRNPYRWSFDRSTGDQWIADVGQNLYEEVDLRTYGTNDNRNYGWNLCEGFHTYPGGVAGCPVSTGTAAPLLEYDHSGGRCAIIGGFRYRGRIGALDGTYTFSDDCSGQVYLLYKGTGTSTCPGGFTGLGSGWACTLFAPSSGPATISAPSGFGEDEAGNLYVVGVNSSTLYKFVSPDAIFANSFDW